MSELQGDHKESSYQARSHSLLEDAVMVGKGAEGTYSRGWDPASPGAFLQHGHTAGSIQPQFGRYSWTGQGSHSDRGPACKPPSSC